MSGRLFSKRLSKELQNYNYTVQDDVFTFSHNTKLYTLDVGTSYPFRAPELILSNNHIISYNPQLYPPRLWAEYKTLTNKCMCCHNMLCAENWTPARHILQVIREYEDFIESLKTILKKRIFRFVDLPDDMIQYIGEFLFVVR